jgi:hypothetical protein
MAEMTFEEIVAAVQQFSPDEKRKLLEELKRLRELENLGSEAQTVKILSDGNS